MDTFYSEMCNRKETLVNQFKKKEIEGNKKNCYNVHFGPNYQTFIINVCYFLVDPISQSRK